MELFLRDGRPTFFQHCRLCGRRARYGFTPPTPWRETRPPYMIGPAGVATCGLHWLVPLTAWVGGDSWEVHHEPWLKAWTKRGHALWKSLGVLHRRQPLYYRPPGVPRPPAKRQARSVSGRRSSLSRPASRCGKRSGSGTSTTSDGDGASFWRRSATWFRGRGV